MHYVTDLPLMAATITPGATKARSQAVLQDAGQRLRSLVALLLASCGPTNVARFVVAVVIDPIKAHAFRTLAHVGKEVLEFLPTFADKDAPSTPVLKSGMGLPSAALNHRVPNVVLRRIASAVSRDYLVTITTTTQRSFKTKRRRVDGALSSTGTKAKPSSWLGSGHLFHNGPAPYLSSSHVNLPHSLSVAEGF